MKALYFPLSCFSIAIPIVMICGLLPEYIANILRGLISLVILACLVLFFFKTDKPKNRVVSLNFIFYGICTSFTATFFLAQIFNPAFLMSLLLIFCPFLFLLFLVSILSVLVIEMFQSYNIISKSLFASEFLLTLVWVTFLINQGHNIQNTLNIFAISFSVLLAMISFSVKYAR